FNNLFGMIADHMASTGITLALCQLFKVAAAKTDRVPALPVIGGNQYAVGSAVLHQRCQSAGLHKRHVTQTDQYTAPVCGYLLYAPGKALAHAGLGIFAQAQDLV